jgi:hypothetical protein
MNRRLTLSADGERFGKPAGGMACAVSRLRSTARLALD